MIANYYLCQLSAHYRVVALWHVFQDGRVFVISARIAVSLRMLTFVRRWCTCFARYFQQLSSPSNEAGADLHFAIACYKGLLYVETLCGFYFTRHVENPPHQPR